MNTKRKTLGEIVNGRPAYVLQTGSSVMEAVRYMSELRIGAVPILDGEGLLLGIFTERDLMTRVVAQGLDATSVTVDDVMTRKVAVLGEDSTYDQALAVMNALHVRHLPVMIGQSVVGCVSIRDLHEADMEVKAREIEFLDDYIDRIERVL